jgi:hypothetical protein
METSENPPLRIQNIWSFLSLIGHEYFYPWNENSLDHLIECVSGAFEMGRLKYCAFFSGTVFIQNLD